MTSSPPQWLERARVTPPGFVLRLLAVMLIAPVACLGAKQDKRVFDVPAGAAEQALKRFSQQAGLQVVFAPDVTDGVRTPAVKGEFTPMEAVNRLLSDTGLDVIVDEKTAVLSIVRLDKAERPGPNVQRAAQPARSARPGDGRDQQSGLAVQDEVLALSPFEVTADNKGYYAVNTMSGTRLNSRIEDLGASITVVTKEQMADFAMLDVSDIFMYEAGTEGSRTFTDVSFDSNGQPTDNTQMDPQIANRVRGIGPVQRTFGNFEVSGRVPMDPINIDAVEISRGANSSIFGLGSAAGAINSVPASASLQKNRAQVSARVDSNDGYRTTFDVNRVLKPGMLGVRASAVYQREGFDLKPSGVDTRRFNGMLKFRPFKTTTLGVSYMYHRLEGVRPNAIMPRDAITGWVEAGSPTWDPVGRVIKVRGVPISGNAAAPYFQIIGRSFTQVYVDQGGIGYWGLGRGTTGTPATAAQPQEIRGAAPDPSGVRAAQPLIADYPSLQDDSLYDWRSINLSAANRIRDEGQIVYATLDQFLLDTPRQTLAVQLGWLRESGERWERNSIGQASGSANSPLLLQVDVNERMLDGRPNPYFLRPFIGVANPSWFERPLDYDNYRGQLAYKLDLTGEKGLWRWLGKHLLSGYSEYKEQRNLAFEYKDSIVDGHAWIPAGQPRANFSSGGAGGLPGPGLPVAAGSYFRNYVGDAVGNNVDYASTAYMHGAYSLRWGDAVTGAFTDEPAVLGGAINTANKATTIIKTRGAILQSTLLQDRVVTTFGHRFDQRYARRRSVTDFRYLPGGIEVDYADLHQRRNEPWFLGEGPTRTAGIVVKPLRWLSLYANKSDSFLPQDIRYDLRQRILPDTTGDTKDYGLAMSLLRGDLVVRINRYTTSQRGARIANTIAVRALRLDYDNSGTGATQVNMLETKAGEWVDAAAIQQGTTLTRDQRQQRVADIMKLPVEALNFIATDTPIGVTEDAIARGIEIELNYNPTRFWTSKLNLTRQEAISANLSADLQSWIDQRLPVWRSVIDPVINRPWFTERYNNTESAETTFIRDIQAPLKLARAQEGLSKPQIRKYRVNFSTNYQLEGLTGHKFLRRLNLGGALRWEDKGAIGYYGLQQGTAVINEYDPSRPIYDKSHLYVDLLVGYRARLFKDRVPVRFQLNVRNVGEDGNLQPVAADPDGTPTVIRIVEPRTFILSATFDL